MTLTREIKNRIASELNSEIVSAQALSGGCISDAYRIVLKTGENYFLKLNNHSPSDMFIKEANGLRELKKAGAIKVPEVILATHDFIILELITKGNTKRIFFEEFGENFADLHKYHSEYFGFYEDNYIGSTKQNNIPAEDERLNWAEFYLHKRILFQYRLAEKNGYATEELRAGIKFLENNIFKILEGSEEKPSLLHGDLWSGNYMVDETGSACLIDPAVYYGHREADIAMTKLFGGFSYDFYESYNKTFPLLPGWEYRENVYKLYHVLNHLNLFGRSYYHQAIALIKYYQ